MPNHLDGVAQSFVTRCAGLGEVLEAAKHIHERNGNRAIGKYIPPGTASGLLYLMGSSDSDSTEAASA